MDVLRVMNQITTPALSLRSWRRFSQRSRDGRVKPAIMGFAHQKILFTTKKTVFPMSFGLVLRTKGSEIWDRVHVTGKDDRKRPLVGAYSNYRISEIVNYCNMMYYVYYPSQVEMGKLMAGEPIRSRKLVTHSIP